LKWEKKMTCKKILVTIALLTFASCGAATVYGQTYDLSWFTIDGGGYSAGANFEGRTG
jgi:hypothetical protein